MKIQELTIGLRIKHPQYGIGVVESINKAAAEIRFDNMLRTVDPQLSEVTPAEAAVEISGLTQPLKTFIESTIESVITRMGYEKPEAVSNLLASRWHRGKAVLHPADPTLQRKEVPLEVFFHKVVGIRNQLRVLEQKINAHPNLTDGEKVDMQQYVTRCYGSLTTFNLLFKEKEDQF